MSRQTSRSNRGLILSVPFCSPLTETRSSVISPAKQVLVMTWSWILAGEVFLPVMAMVQDGLAAFAPAGIVGGTVTWGLGAAWVAELGEAG